MKIAEALKLKKEGRTVSKSTKKVTLRKLANKPSIIQIIHTYLEHRKGFVPFDAHIKRNDLIGFHPSGLQGACPRQIAFQYLFEKKLFSEEVVEQELHELTNKIKYAPLELIFDFGHLIHMLIQYSYLKDFDKCSVEVSVKYLFKQYLIAGTSDIVMTLQDLREYVIDIKSMNNKKFYTLKSKDDCPIENVKQLGIYIKGMNKKYGCLLYVNKDTGEMKEFFFSLAEIDIQPELNVATEGKKFLQGTKVPLILRECKKLKGKYTYCNFRSICFQCNKSTDLIRFTNKKKYSELVK